MERDFDEITLPLDEPVSIAPGVLVERRCFLKTVALALGAVAVPGSLLALAPSASGERLTFEEFLETTIPVARRLVADTSAAGQNVYLQTLASYAVRLVDVPTPPMKDSGQGAGPGTFIGFNPGGDPYTVLHWKMEPGSRIRWHAHTYGNVVTLGLEGEVRVQNFEMLGGRDFEAKGTFRVRRTQDQRLTPGEVNLVNLERDYIHGSIAGPGGGRGLDITTRIREKQPTPYLDLAKAPTGEGGNEFDASWTT
jgi:hypothetical protein